MLKLKRKLSLQKQIKSKADAEILKINNKKKAAEDEVAKLNLQKKAAEKAVENFGKETV